MRYLNRERRRRPRSRMDSTGPMRQAEHVAGRDAKRLAEAVTLVRTRLGLTQEEFAERCGLSPTTIQRVEAAEVQPRSKTFNGLDRGAGWVPGSARLAYEQSREPVEIENVAESATEGGRPVGLLESWTDEELERIRRATRQAIADEAASVAKFAGDDAHFRFLHDVALIKLAAVSAVRGQGTVAL